MTTAQADFVGFMPTLDPRWNEALSKVRHDFFHLPGYAKASGIHEGGEPMVFLLDAGDRGMLVPIIKRSLAQFGSDYADYYDVTSPYGYPAPLYWGDDWHSSLPEMHGAFEEFLREQHVVSLFLRLHPFLGAADAQLARLGTIKIHGRVVYIDLLDPEQSWDDINDRDRRFITQKVNRGFKVRIDQWDTIDQVIEAYHETMKRLDASPFYLFSKEYFHCLARETSPHLHLATSYAPTGEIMGGVLFTETHGLMHYYLMGIFEDFMDVSPAKLLINALRLWGIENGHHTLHLGGGLGACQDGLFQFKARFSKSFATFSTFRKVILPEVYEALAADQGTGPIQEEFFPIYRKPD